MRREQRGGTLLGLVMGGLIGLGIALAVAVYITKMPVPFTNKAPQRTVESDAAEILKNRNWNPNAALAGKSPAKAGSLLPGEIAAEDMSAPALSVPDPTRLSERPAKAPRVAALAPAEPGAIAPVPAASAKSAKPATALIPALPAVPAPSTTSAIAPALPGSAGSAIPALAATAPAKPAKPVSSDLLGELAKSRAGDPIADMARARSGDPLGDLAKSRSRSADLAVPAPASDPFSYFVQAGAFRTPEEAEKQRSRLQTLGMTFRVTEREQAGRMVYRVRIGPFDKKDDADTMKARIEGHSIETALVRVQR